MTKISVCGNTCLGTWPETSLRFHDREFSVGLSLIRIEDNKEDLRKIFPEILNNKDVRTIEVEEV
jgi:hypothetical protein